MAGTTRLGAKPNEWMWWIEVMKQGPNLLPSIADKHAPIAPLSTLKPGNMGKIPSRYNPARQAVGFHDWSNHQATDRELKAWIKELSYSLSLTLREFVGVDIDTPNPDDTAPIADAIEMMFGRAPMRYRVDSGKILLLYRLDAPKGFIVPKLVTHLPDDKGQVEFLGGKQQTVICGTNPSGARLEWDWRGIEKLEDVPTMTPEDVPLVAQMIAEMTGGRVGKAGGSSVHPVTDPEVLAQLRASQDPVVPWLVEHGWVRGENGDGKIFVTCPNADEHTSEGDVTETVYLPVGHNDVAQAGFKCQHAHCDWLTVHHFRRMVGYDDPMKDFEDLTESASDSDGGPADGAAGEDEVETLVLSQVHPGASAKHFLARKYLKEGAMTLRRWRNLWWVWRNNHWVVLGEESLVAGVRRFLYDAHVVSAEGERKPFPVKIAAVKEVLAGVEAEVLVPDDQPVPSWFGKPPVGVDLERTIPTRNANVNLVDGSSWPANPRLWTTHAASIPWDPEAADPTQWLRFLGEVFGGDGETIEVLREMFGLLLSNDLRFQKLFLLLGPPRSGKGTILRILDALLGAGVAATTLRDFMGNFGLEPLQGASVCVFPDLRQHDSRPESLQPAIERMLSITGQDVVPINRKGRPQVYGRLPVRFVIASNRMPHLPDTSGAIASRFIILSTTESYLGREDLYLTDRLVKELPGILKWAVEGAVRLFKRGFFVMPQASIEDQDLMFDLSAPVGRFVRDHCERGKALRDEVSLVYAAYELWCEEVGMEPMDKVHFGKALREFAQVQRARGPREEGGHRSWLYRGLRLDTSSDLYGDAIVRRDQDQAGFD